jgi:hypothetical protein
MSTDWNVHCRTCTDTHSFDDANHQEELMWLLIDHASAIAALAPLMEADRNLVVQFKAGRYGGIDTKWFANHLGHDLVPISEYGDIGKRGEQG